MSSTISRTIYKSVATILLFSIFSRTYSQCGNCGQDFIINGDFENIVCSPNVFNNQFSLGCVEGWDIGIQSYAAVPSNAGSDFQICISSFLSNNVAVIPTGNVSRGFVNSNVLWGPPNVSYSLNLDVAVLSPEDIQVGGICSQGSIPNCQLEVYLNEELATTIPVDESNSLSNGFTSICIENLTPTQNMNSSLGFFNTPIDMPDPSMIPAFLFVDNVSMDCKIDESNYVITETGLPSLDYSFDLQELDPNSYSSIVDEILWDFGDGNTSSETNPIHTYSSAGFYTVTASITDDFGCCTTLTKTIGVELISCSEAIILTGNNTIDNLTDVLGTFDLENVIADVLVAGTLTFNSNATIGPGLNFFLSEGSSIIIESGTFVTKSGGFISACDNQMQGVIIEAGANLDVNGVSIINAAEALRLESGSRLSAIDCRFVDSGTGIQISGSVLVLSFEGNTFQNCDFGINAENAGSLDIIGTASGPNQFLNCNSMGIRYWKTSGKISNNIFDNCRFGIFIHRATGSSTIENNVVNGIETAIAVLESTYTKIEGNTIGESFPIPRYGIYSDLSSTVIEDNPLIKATWRGVAIYHPTWLTLWDNSDIQVNGNDAHGIYLWKDQVGNGVVMQNNITGNMLNCIYATSCAGKNISANNLSGGNNQGVALTGGGDMIVGGNTIYDSPNNGIGVYSSVGNRIAFNQINGKNNGLRVGNNSMTQSIFCNDFQSGTVDISTKSVLGPQYHHNNEFRKVGSEAKTNGLAPDEIDQSRFIVELCNNNSSTCKHPENWSGNGFFRMGQFDPNGSTDEWTEGTYCYNPPGLGQLGSPDYWCWLMANIHSSSSLDQRQFWIQRYIALKLNSQNNKQLIPDPCILCHCNPDDCGMTELIEAEQAVNDVLVSAADSGEDYFETISTGVETIILELDTITCYDETFELYRETYRTLLKNMIRIELVPSEVDDLRNTADLCPDVYGEVVYWARGVLDHRGEIHSYNDILCGVEENNIEQRVRKETVSPFKIIPNPANNYFTLVNNTHEIYKVDIVDIYGQQCNSQTVLNERLEVDCSTYPPGLYIINIIGKDGRIVTEKVIIGRN